MIQDTLLFSTKFNVVPTVGKFVFTDLSPYAGEGIALTNVKGVFKIEGPSGIIYNNTNFAAPDIAANVSLVFNTVSLPLDTDGKILKGNYIITYTIRVAGGVQPGDYIKTSTLYFCYDAPDGDIQVTNSVRLAKVTSKDLTSYPISGIMPTITRTHTLWYPSSLSLSPTISGLDEIQLSYPNVYTGTYTGKISTVASYVFTDGLIVDYLITAVDETIVDNKTLCDIYCGIKNLTNEMLTARSTGDFGKADKIQETLALVSILFTLYDDAITCGKEDDATNWLNQIITLANITVGCGCTGDEPSLVIPEGGAGSGGDTVVQGDASFGTAVTSVTVGPTTTYTVRLTQAYKDLILSALQAQDLSVTAFRAAGIPEEARGVTVTPVTSGGGTMSLTPGVSKKILVLTGTATLSSSLTVQTVGSPIDGDSFIVDYRATLTPNGNNVTIFGLGLSPSEAASGNCLIYTWYAASNTTWYAKLISNEAGTAVQEGLSFWVSGPDFALSKTVLYGSNPSYIYKNIQVSGSGTNAPTGTTASNTWWQFVGNKSGLYDSGDNLVFDVTTGKPFIIPALNTSASTFEFLVLEGQEIKQRAKANISAAGFGLTNGKILVGDGSNVAAEQTLSNSLLRAIPINGITGGTFSDLTLASSGTQTLTPSTSSPIVRITGTATLVGALSYNLLTTPTPIAGDYFWIDYNGNATIGGNTLTIAGQSLTAAEALAGNIAIYAYWNSVASTWISRKIAYGAAVPSGTNNQTLRYNSSNQLEAVPNVLVYNNGDARFLGRMVLGNSPMSTNRSFIIGDTGSDTGVGGSFVLGDANSNTGRWSVLAGNNNTNSSSGSILTGPGNNNSGDSSYIGGNTNVNSASSSLVVGNSNNNGGLASLLTGNGNVNTSAGGLLSGYSNTSSSFCGFTFGQSGRNLNMYSSVQGGGAFGVGLNQKECFITNAVTTNAVAVNSALCTLNNIGNTCAYLATYTVTAIQTGGSAGAAGDCKTFKFIQMVKLSGGVASLIGSATSLFTGTSGGLTVTAAPYVSGFLLGTTITGDLNKNINWTISIDLVNAGF